MRSWCAAALVVLAAAGCGGPEGPATHPAGGRVVYAGGAPMPGGMVQFLPQGGGDSTLGAVGKDGAFTLFTLADGKKFPGAVAGNYRVTVLPPLGSGSAGQAAPRPMTLSGMYTVRPEGGNDFTLVLPRP